MNCFLIWLLAVGAPGVYAVVVLFRYPRLWLFCLLVIATATVMVGLPIYWVLCLRDPMDGFLVVGLLFGLTTSVGPLHLGFTLMLIGYVIEERKLSM